MIMTILSQSSSYFSAFYAETKDAIDLVMRIQRNFGMENSIYFTFNLNLSNFLKFHDATQKYNAVSNKVFKSVSIKSFVTISMIFS